MARDLMDLVLPRLARPLYRQLERFQTGKMNEDQFAERFEGILRRQHVWLEKRGISAARAALAIHAAVLVLSQSGLRAEAAEDGVPLEIVEIHAIREAASDLANKYGFDASKAANALSSLLALYGD